MSVTISTTGSILNLTFSDGRVMGIEASNIIRTDLKDGYVYIYQTILQNNKTIYAQNPDVIKLDYTDTTPSYASAALLYAYLNALIGSLTTGGVAGTTTGSTVSMSANYFSPEDFTATYTSATTITLSALPFTPTAEQLKYILVVNSSGVATPYVQGVDGVSLSISSNVITITGVTDPFASGDIYEVGILGQRKPYDTSTQSDKTTVLNTEYFHNKSNPNWSETLSSTAKSYYAIPMANYKGGSITFRGTMGAGSSGVLKAYLTNDPDENTSTITIANWHDDSTDALGAASVTLPAATTTDQVIHLDTNYGCQFLLLEVDYTHSANSTITINSYIN